jgi:hypothetical protein
MIKVNNDKSKNKIGSARNIDIFEKYILKLKALVFTRMLKVSTWKSIIAEDKLEIGSEMTGTISTRSPPMW